MRWKWSHSSLQVKEFEAMVVKWSFFVGVEVIPDIGRKWGRKENCEPGV